MFALQQYGDLVVLFLRVVIGVVFFVHGKAKWGMWKVQPSEQMSKTMLIKLRILSVAETLGGIAVLIGFWTQLAALGLALIMLGATDFKIRTLHRTLTDSAGGWELDLALLAGSLVLVVFGSGVIAVDTFLFFF